MITAIAVLLAVIAEALVVYAAAELFAAGFNPSHAVHGLVFVIAALAAFLFPRGAAIAGLSGRTAAVAFAVVTWLFVYAPVHVQFAGNLAIWDVRWILDFIREPADAIEGAGGRN